ncbi:hypothetical protein DAMA08_029620 [Martiniozyma asiatica (nom. inval.)]|nr:hypothetical protein DAMA08_029620 [Martiniozyma asiatica]
MIDFGKSADESISKGRLPSATNQGTPTSKLPLLNLANERENVAGGFKIKKSRKKHKNSRFGCSFCKARKIKCDETLPNCQNCVKRNVECQYLTMTPCQINAIIQSHNGNLKSDLASTHQKENYDEYPVSSCIDLNVSLKSSNGMNELSVSQLSDDLQSARVNESIYHATELEQVLLPDVKMNSQKMDINKSPSKKIIDASYKMKTKNDEVIKGPKSNNITVSLLSSTTKTVNKTFKLYPKKELEILAPFFSKMMDIDDALLVTRNFADLCRKYRIEDLDFEMKKNFCYVMILSTRFGYLIRKSLILFACSFFKNVLLRQRILIKDSYKIKILISGICEQTSVEYVDDITHLIGDVYLPKYYTFPEQKVSIFIGSVVVLDHLLPYHFKNGLKTEISEEAGNNAISKIGIFICGLYSIAMTDSPLIGVRTVASHLNLAAKFVIYPPSKMELLFELKRTIEKIGVQNDAGVSFENLLNFLKKHHLLMKFNTRPDSFLGCTPSYALRLINDFYQIFPVDCGNYNLIFQNDDLNVVILLAYRAVSSLLDEIFPAMKSLMSQTLTDSNYPCDNIKVMMQLFRKMKSKELQIHAMYLIRVISYCNIRRKVYRSYLLNYHIPELSHPPHGMDLFERVRRLQTLRVKGVMNENPVRSLKIRAGSFLLSGNFPSINVSKNQRKAKIEDEFSNTDEMINDFITKNDGFFSKDHDPFKVTEEDQNRVTKKTISVAVESPVINGDAIKEVWKILTHIRVHQA